MVDLVKNLSLEGGNLRSDIDLTHTRKLTAKLAHLHFKLNLFVKESALAFKVNARFRFKRVKEFAEAKGYDMVLDSQAAVFGKKSFDVTDEILKAMGVDPAKAKNVNESK